MPYYRFTIAHHVELGVIAGGLASAPLSGAATVAPPAGAVITKIKYNAYLTIVAMRIIFRCINIPIPISALYTTHAYFPNHNIAFELLNPIEEMIIRDTPTHRETDTHFSKLLWKLGLVSDRGAPTYRNLALYGSRTRPSMH
jgi:hypothetical protein